jgi:Ca-activated chloride channel family protein
MDLVTSRSAGQDGFFCLTLTAGQEVAAKQDGMDYVFVLDASGSMAESGKMLISKDAVAAFLDELSDADRFEVITFNVRPDLGFGQLEAATESARKRAQEYLSRQPARGGTVLQPAIATAYKYAAADRPLNVVILSDGLTEQAERQVLLQQIQARPGNTRVFCIGVGNDVNRPLLEQLAEDSGGLAAFLSSGDNFGRQARAFRQKLTRPFATGLEIKIAGVEALELEPPTMPNLYYGAPVRVYGRYRGNGSAEITLRGSINGQEFKQAASLAFPKTDLANPEIDRLWAWHRINSLLKDADRRGDRGPAVPQVVRLGEDFSIVTEYTSFLVLENDAEYQRWKIARKNLDATGRDRLAQAKRSDQLAAIRNKALENLGPQAAAPEAKPPVQLAAGPRPVNPTPAAQSSPAQTQAAPATRQGFDLNLGGGGGSSPIGPLGVVTALWFLRRKQAARKNS